MCLNLKPSPVHPRSLMAHWRQVLRVSDTPLRPSTMREYLRSLLENAVDEFDS